MASKAGTTDPNPVGSPELANASQNSPMAPTKNAPTRSTSGDGLPRRIARHANRKATPPQGPKLAASTSGLVEPLMTWRRTDPSTTTATMPATNMATGRRRTRVGTSFSMVPTRGSARLQLTTLGVPGGAGGCARARPPAQRLTSRPGSCRDSRTGAPRLDCARRPRCGSSGPRRRTTRALQRCR